MKMIPIDTTAEKIDDAQQVSQYLKAGTVLMVAAGMEVDVVDPTKGTVATIGTATDGVNVWPLSLAYYVENYQIGLDEEFLAEIRQKNYTCSPVSDAQLDIVRDELMTYSRSEGVAMGQSGDPEDIPHIDPFRK